MPRSTDPAPQPIAAGAPLALCTVIGALAGAIEGQVTIGIIGGVVAGGTIAILLWLRDRKRLGR